MSAGFTGMYHNRGGTVYSGADKLPCRLSMTARTMRTIDALQALPDCGPSVWRAYICRSRLVSREVHRLVAEDGVCGAM